MAQNDKKRDEALLQAAADDRDCLKFACDQFADHINSLVGTHFRKNGSENPVPNNKFAVLLNTLMPLLAGKNPQVGVTTKKQALYSVSMAFENAFPQRLDQLDYENSTRRQTASAVFAPMGISKIGREYIRTEMVDGIPMRVTEPYDREVLLEDFVYDTQAKTWRDVQYAADRTEVDFERFMDTYEGEMTPDARDSFAAKGRDRHSSSRDDGGRVAEVSRSDGTYRGQYRKTLPIWSFWCRDEERIKIFDAIRDGTRLIDIPYQGPVEGPYHFLNFTDVPGEILGLAPAAILRDIVDALNLSLNKAIKQAEIQKTLYGFRDAETADLVRTQPDGYTFNSQTPEVFQTVRVGGADQANVGMAVTAGHVLDEMFPLTLLGGFGASSPTATQDSILQGNAGRAVAYMAYRVHTFQRSKLRHIAEDMWADQLYDPDITYTPPGSRLVFKLSFAPEVRYGSFPEYDIDLVPFSMVATSPNERWNEIVQFVQAVVIPAAPFMAQQGDYINWKEYINGWAKAKGYEAEFQRFIIHGDRQAMMKPSGGRPTPMQSSSARGNHAAQGRPQATEQLAQMLIGGQKSNGTREGSY